WARTTWTLTIEYAIPPGRFTRPESRPRGNQPSCPRQVPVTPACSPSPRGLEAGHRSQPRQAHAMKQQANLIRAGQVIEHEGRRWTVHKQKIITPGKGGPFIQGKMRALKSGNKTNERWRTADTVERLMTEEKDYTYSYADGSNL